MAFGFGGGLCWASGHALEGADLSCHARLHHHNFAIRPMTQHCLAVHPLVRHQSLENRRLRQFRASQHVSARAET
eukprot:221299-Rhodomonas_salina.3